MKRIWIGILALLLIGCVGKGAPTNPENAPQDTAETVVRATELDPTASAADPADAQTERVENTPTEDEPAPATEAPAPTAEQGGTDTLVLYFSRVGNTPFASDTDAVSSASLLREGEELVGNAQKIAQWIADETGGDLTAIETEKAYPIDYRETTNDAKAEQNEKARPALKTALSDLERYETVYLVYPNWWGDLPMPLYTLLEQYDFSGKTLRLFVTHEGSGFSRTVETVTALEPNATVVKGLSIRGGDVPKSEEQVRTRVRDDG